jgi:aminoglycoside phosphotransferase (APT) family kinase protein
MHLEMIGEGKTTKVYRDGNVAIKLYVNALPDEACNEAKRQDFAVKAGLPVPEVYGVKELDCGVALEMQYIDGQDIVRPKMDKDARRAAFKRLVGLQHEVHKINAESQPSLYQRLVRKIEESDALEKRLIPLLLDRLAVLDRGKTCLCHSDFHTSNVLDDGSKLWIIDWVDAAYGDPLADVCRTYLIFKQYITRMAAVYLNMYCKVAGVKPEAVLAWLPIVAAARLKENLNKKETAFIMDVIHSGMADPLASKS